MWYDVGISNNVLHVYQCTECQQFKNIISSGYGRTKNPGPGQT